MSPHRTLRSRRFLFLCASATLFAIATPSHAIQRFWNNSSGGAFNLNTNWSTGVVPNPGDSAYFSMGAFTYTVNFPTAVSNTQLTIDQNNVTFDLLSHQYQLTNIGSDITTAPIRVGAQVGDNAFLRIINGTLTGNTTVIGWVSGSEDNLFVSTSSILSSPNIDIGHFGIGHLTIDSGGIVNSANAILGSGGVGSLSNGYAAVTGAGSTWNNSSTITVGNGHPGHLSIDAGGAVNTDQLTINGASSNATVAGATSTLHTRNLTISGGTLTHTGGNIQVSSGGSVPATGIYVGLGGGGTLEVNSGGHLNTTGIVSMGHFASGNGVANLNNTGTNWTHTGEFNIGVAGAAQFNIGSGATASSSGVAYIARGAGSVGFLTINGVNSRWDIADDLFLSVGTSQMSIIGGGTLTDNNAFVSPAASADSKIFVYSAGSQWNTAHSIELAGSGGAGLGIATLNVGTAAPGGTVTAGDSIKVWNLGTINQNSGEIRTPLLTIQGGTVKNNTGILNIDPASSPFATNGVYIGINGIGNAIINAGGKLTTNNEAYVGVYGSSSGNVTIDGAGATWTVNSSIVIGDAGKGIVTLDNGALVSITGTETRIGFAAGSTGSVTVDGTSATDPSTLTTTGFMDVGTFGTGFLTVTNQAFVKTNDLTVGRNAGGKGTVKISDNLAELRASNVYIAGDSLGPGGVGTVNVSNNGVLTVAGPITVWTNGQLQSYPVGITTSELRLRGGRFSAWSNFNAPVSNGGGTIEVPGSNILFLNNTLTSLAGSLLTRVGTGDLWIMGTQNHAPNSTFQSMGGQTFLRTNAGTPATAAAPATANLNVIVGPGNGAKIQLFTNQVFKQLTVNTASAGRQSFDLNSPPAAGAFSTVSIYTPATKPDLWAAIINANRTGAPDPQDGIFDSGIGAHPNSRIGIARLADAHGDPYVLIRPARIGDLNLDGTVTISDFIDLSSNFNSSGPNVTWQEGDVNYDNAVTIADFIDLSANFGGSYAGDITPISAEDQQLLSAFATAHAVPEPGALSLLITAAALSRRLRRNPSAMLRYS